MPAVPRTLLEERVGKDSSKSTGLSIPPSEVVARYGMKAPDGVDLLVMGRVAHAGAG
jgi:CO dehydrogenase nickel-insertion accessory protein CooC1